MQPNPPEVNSFTLDERSEYLKTEADHFFRSELHSEQRASWLLTIAFGAQVGVLNAFVQVWDGKLNTRAMPALVVCSLILFLTICSALWALWPLEGAQGSLGRPWRVHRRKFPPIIDQATTWERHYEAHRKRAEIKVVRVVVTLLWLFLSVAASAVAVALNAGIL